MQADHIVIRAPSGLGGDMLAAGLAKLLDLDNPALAARVNRIGLPAVDGVALLEPRGVQGIGGWGLRVTLPQQHVHRSLRDIETIIDGSTLAVAAREVALRAFRRLAQVEGEVHGIPPEQVRFHEVGALDSILDVCLAAELHAELGSPQVVCGALPVSDGTVRCAHGVLATPAPAVLRMLEGVPVYGVEGVGETLTPTAMALLHAWGTHYGPWPAMTVLRTTRIYGTRVLHGVPNGAIFASGLAQASLPVQGHPHGHPHGHDHGDEHGHAHLLKVAP